MKNLKILIIGSISKEIGGTVISLKNLIHHLQIKKINVQIINSAGIRNGNIKGIFIYFLIVIKLFFKIPYTNIINLHVTPSALLYIGPTIYLLNFLYKKPFIIRTFGGLGYRNFKGLKRRIVRACLLHASHYLAQTKSLVSFCESDGIKNISWYPTSRFFNDSVCLKVLKKHCKQFCYIGHVRIYKGIKELIEASERFGPDIWVDVFGPFYDNLDETLFKNCERIKYKGILEYKDVIPTLHKYDALLLPTKAPTEGYPGTIPEAFAAGLPVIASNCGGIPEMIDNTCGILIEPGNINSLYFAMKKIADDNEFFIKLQKGALARRDLFSAEKWGDEFIKLCERLHSI